MTGPLAVDQERGAPCPAACATCHNGSTSDRASRLTRSGAAVGAVPKRAEQQGNVEVFLGVPDVERDLDLREKGDVQSLIPVIRADVEGEPIRPRRHRT